MPAVIKLERKFLKAEILCTNTRHHHHHQQPLTHPPVHIHTSNASHSISHLSMWYWEEHRVLVFPLRSPTSDLWDKPASLTFKQNLIRRARQRTLYSTHISQHGENIYERVPSFIFFFFKGPKSQPGTRGEIFLPL